MMKATLPQNVIRYCPQCGYSGFQYRDDNSFFCSKCQLQLYINSAAAVAALIFDDQNRILLTRRAIEPHKGMLELPGGFIDVMETAEEALHREIAEELNLEIDQHVYFTSSPNEYIFGGLSVFTLDLAYICRVNSFKNIKARDDVIEYLFVHPDAINEEEISSPSMKRIIRSYLNHITQ